VGYKENYTTFISVGFVLTLAILGTFQVYLWREPIRIDRDIARDLQAKISAGERLFTENCSSCHGIKGQGGLGPALNSQEFLALSSDEALFSLTQTGVPGTRMPAWGQMLGGPLTDEEITQLVTFVRSWEPTAPKLDLADEHPDPARGAIIYNQTCFICHGDEGGGTDIAPALNDPERLGNLDDNWYRNTIARGRPAKGMPTWGTVLAPNQISDVVALIGAWREGRTVSAEIPLASMITNALFALREFDRPDAIFYLDQAKEVVTQDNQREEIEAIMVLIEDNHLFEAQSLLIAFLPPEEMGRAVYDTNCASCHGADGNGGIGPGLRGNSFIQARSDEELLDFILKGRRGTAMDGFEGILGTDELGNTIVLLRSWQE